jgi:hypothetical protein
LWNYLETICRNGESQSQPRDPLRRRRNGQPQPRQAEGRSDRLSAKVEITENPRDDLSDEQLDADREEMNNGLLERAAKGDPEAIERALRRRLLPTP